MPKYKAELMDEAGMNRALLRIAHEIIEKNSGAADVVLVGIKRRGVTLAQKIAENIKKAEGAQVETGVLDITLYRDDLTTLKEIPTVNDTCLPQNINDKIIIIVDDVLYTGRTARAAIEAIFSRGRPSSIQLAILIDRGHRQLPIRADYVGKNVPTSASEVIAVNVIEYDGKNSVELYELDV